MTAISRSRADFASARRAFERAARAPAQSVVAEHAARRMEARLDFVKLEPRRVLDAGCGAGADVRLLRRRFADAAFVGVDASLGQVRAALAARSLGERLSAFVSRAPATYLCADMRRLPFPEASAQLVWSNLALPWASDPAEVFREFARVLSPGGLLSFATYGPDTLKELRAAFASVDQGVHVHEFIDMHDLGDMLVASGLAAPVMDMEALSLTYTSVRALAGELRATGQVNVAGGRSRGLMPRGTWQKLLDACEKLRVDGRLAMTVELVFGHAWKPESTRRENVAPIRFHR